MVGIARPGGPPRGTNPRDAAKMSRPTVPRRWRSNSKASQKLHVLARSPCWHPRTRNSIPACPRSTQAVRCFPQSHVTRTGPCDCQIHCSRATFLNDCLVYQLRYRRYLSARRASFPHRTRRQPASIIQQVRSVFRLERLAAHARQPYLIAYTCVGAAPTEDSVRHTSTPLGFGWTLASFGETAPQGVSQ
jgi:hypothetical protein